MRVGLKQPVDEHHVPIRISDAVQKPSGSCSPHARAQLRNPRPRPRYLLPLQHGDGLLRNLFCRYLRFEV